jgi:iron(III) transport system ATP-binding protein
MTQHVQTDRSDDSPETATDGAEPMEDRPEPTVLALDAVAKSYGAETAVQDLSLAVGAGEVLALLGPSGCGKTTTLRLLSGLERPDAGTITLGDETVADAADGTFVQPESRGIGMVFQDFALFPHMTAAENVGFGIADRPDAARTERVTELLELVDLDGHGDDYPNELSGGQKQRVALARSLAPEPDVLLLDEPLSNLDVRLRVSMREEIVSILREADVTAVWVTHDQEEALSVADRVGVMHDGRLQQVGRPERIFERPNSRFVAEFLGQTGFLTARVGEDAVRTEIGQIDHDRFEGLHGYEGAHVEVLVRPDDLRARSVADSDAAAHGEITRRQYQGPSFVYRVETDDGDVVHCRHNHTKIFDVGDPVQVDLVADHPLKWYPHE